MMENLPEVVGIVVSILGVIGGVFKFVQDKITANENRLDELEDMQKELDKKISVIEHDVENQQKKLDRLEAKVDNLLMLMHDIKVSIARITPKDQ